MEAPKHLQTGLTQRKERYMGTFVDITIEMSLNLIKESASPALICGNGLSINFEPNLALGQLSKNMYKTHMHVMKFGDYAVTSKAMEAYTSNYSATMKHLKKSIHNQEDFTSLFEDAIRFAKIINTPSICEWICNNGFNSKLVMGFGPLDYVFELLKQAEASDMALSINYEFWSIIIYFALVLNDAPSNIYSSNENNRFIKAVLCGGQFTRGYIQKNQSGYLEKTCENGVFTYLRLIFSTNILLAGNGYHVDQMSRWNDYNKDELNLFFSLFKNIITTNYDLLIEKLTNRSVSHLHGCYTRQKQVALYQSLGVFVDAVRYDLSSILIGDYFIVKSFFSTATLLAQKFPINTKIRNYNQIFEELIVKEKTDTIVIFGLNVNNDFHILRDLQVYFQRSGLGNAQIVYCYFCEEDKTSFENAYESCITYSPELNDYIRNHISVYTLDSRCILKRFFIRA